VRLDDGADAAQCELFVRCLFARDVCLIVLHRACANFAFWRCQAEGTPKVVARSLAIAPRKFTPNFPAVHFSFLKFACSIFRAVQDVPCSAKLLPLRSLQFGDGMNDLVSLFRNFIYRDLAFILGGSIVVLSISYAVQIYLGIGLEWPEEPYVLVLFVVLAYVVGYSVQDFGAVLFPWLIFTGYVLEPNRFWQYLYRRFTSSASWRPLTFAHTPEEANQFTIHMDRLNIPETTLRDVERIRSLKVISMCVGGCSVLSALIFVGTWVYNHFASIDLIPVILLLALGLALICLGWVKALQEMQFYEAVKAEKFEMRHVSDKM
jgi:hypothetical protein